MTVIDSRLEGETWSAGEDEPGDPLPERPKRRATRSTRTTEQARAARDAARASAPPPPPVERPDVDLPKFAESPMIERGAREKAPARSSQSRSSESRSSESGPEAPKRYRAAIDESKIDPDVEKVVKRLVRHGYEAYLVGGCVRDLLLGHRPKDFDVATSARPEQVRHLFRNSRVIGRRFRLVHVLFHGGKVIEVATFRRNPRQEGPREEAAPRDEPRDEVRREVERDEVEEDTEALLIRADNAFGEAHEDAERRDFTINALFYDCETAEILDYTGGMDDIARRVVNTIGDPEVRFHEDPIRVLRALKFAGRLDLGITPTVYDAIVRCRDSLALAARPRVSEEILRLMRGGAARRTIFLAWETGVLAVLLPELSALLDDAWVGDDPDHERDSAGARVFRLLAFMDEATKSNGAFDDAVLWTLLLLEPLKEACDGARDRSAAAADFLEPLAERLNIPRRFADTMKRILGVLPRLEGGKAGRFARTELFDLALTVAHADLVAQGASIAPLKGLLAARANGDDAGRAQNDGAARVSSTNQGDRPVPPSRRPHARPGDAARTPRR
jgi:poly(A) polymerase